MQFTKIASWSNNFKGLTQKVQFDPKHISENKLKFIARGTGRSLSDDSFIDNGLTISSKNLNKIIDFDDKLGTLVCQSGVEMIKIYDFLKQTDWTLGVAGGSRWVTVGGAIAGDIHGKRHVKYGSYGNAVMSLKLMLADGSEIECSEKKNSDLFHATIGGMGLTGIIIQAKLQLVKDPTHTVDTQTLSFESVGKGINMLKQDGHEYSVVWVDLSNNRQRGLLYSANPSLIKKNNHKRPISIYLPTIEILSPYVVKLMNFTRNYFEANRKGVTSSLNFNYPVDSVKNWNKFYGERGFQECQFIVPYEKADEAIEKFILTCKKNKISPYFCIIKRFGNIKSKGLISFPKPGIAFMADFHAQSKNTKIFSDFNDYLITVGGRINLTKDFCLTPKQFELMYTDIDKWRRIVKKYDPLNRVQSNLSKRLNIKPW